MWCIVPLASVTLLNEYRPQLEYEGYPFVIFVLFQNLPTLLIGRGEINGTADASSIADAVVQEMVPTIFPQNGKSVSVHVQRVSEYRMSQTAAWYECAVAFSTALHGKDVFEVPKSMSCWASNAEIAFHADAFDVTTGKYKIDLEEEFSSLLVGQSGT